MLNKVHEKNKEGKRVAHIVVSHGFFIRDMFSVYQTVHGTEQADCTDAVNHLLADYKSNEIKVADNKKYIDTQKYNPGEMSKYCGITGGHLTYTQENKCSFETTLAVSHEHVKDMLDKK